MNIGSNNTFSIVMNVVVGTFDLSGLAASVSSSEAREARLLENQEARKKAKSPADFLGENASLVNLDNLIDKPPAAAGGWCGVESLIYII